MSGIAGIINIDGAPAEVALLDAMVAATPHLGIDGTRQLRRDSVGLIRFELATKPDAVGKFQIVEDPGSNLMAVFDGRLDNSGDLRTLLGSSAPSTSVTDCALVLAAYDRFGDQFVSHLVGDYALAIWDPVRRRLFCARSPVGWRPFLWTFDGRRFAFATEPATLLRGLRLPRRLNEAAIAEHLAARFVTETETFWEGLYRLPPGHALALENGTVRSWRWHSGPFDDHSHLSEADHVSRFTELFDQALISTLQSAGPVAAQLSGGLDSSTIVSRTHRLLISGIVPAMVRPISVRFPGEICDEGEWIEAVETQCGIRSETVFSAPFESEAMARWCEQTLHLPLRPNTNGTIIATCDRLRQQGIRVLLTGEGGDDWLNGSNSHWPDLLLAGRWGKLLSETFTAEPGAGVLRGLRGIAQAAAPIVSSRRRERLLRPHLDFNATLPRWINPQWAHETRLVQRWRAAPRPPELGSYAQMQRHQVYSMARRHVNVDNVLCYAASRGVELRHPFHDLRLTHFLMGAAGGALRRNGRKKHLLREAMRGTLPEAIRGRTSKANISAPIIDGVTARLAERPFRDLQCVRRGWLDLDALETAHTRHLAWRRSGTEDSVPAMPYAPVWNAIAIDLWLENAFSL